MNLIEILSCAKRTVCVVLPFALTACGGGGSEIPTPPPVPPQQWHAITPPFMQNIMGTLPFTACGTGIVAQSVGFSFNGITVISNDHGLTWQQSRLTGDQELGSSGYYYQPSTFGRPILETRDCGATWSSIGYALLTQCVSKPGSIWRTGNPARLLVAEGSRGGQVAICTSADDGQTWTSGSVLPAAVYAVRGSHWFAISYDASSPGVAQVSRLLQSDDQGLTWQSTGLQSSANGITLIAKTAFGPVIYVLATNQVPRPNGQIVETLWRFNDTTGAWIALPPFPFSIAPTSLLPISLAVNPTTPTQLFLSFGSRIFESRDAGISWADASTGLPFSDIRWDLLFDPSLPNRLYATPAGPTIAFPTYWALDATP